MAETTTNKKVFWLVALSLCWAANASFVKVGDQSFGPITLRVRPVAVDFIH